VWFERLQEQFRAVRGARGSGCSLRFPLELRPGGCSAVARPAEILNAHGFEMAEFGRNFFSRGGCAPRWMEPADARAALLRDVARCVARAGRWRKKIPGFLRRGRTWRGLRRRRLCGLPESASERELQALVAQASLAQRAPLTSPAGRPTFIELNHAELARRV